MSGCVDREFLYGYSCGRDCGVSFYIEIKNVTDVFQLFRVFSSLVFWFSTSETFICAKIKFNCAMFGVIIFLVLCLDVLGTMCGGNSSWGE